MTYFADLSPCNYGGDFLSEFDDYELVDERFMVYAARERKLPLPMAVGWLDAVHTFAVGPVELDFRVRLEALFDAGYSNSQSRGWHACELCEQSTPVPTPEPGKQSMRGVVSGFKNITIPGQRAVYYAPELMLHYIDAHRYQPPIEFRRAVMTCPPFLSEAYFLGLLNVLGPGFAKALAQANVEGTVAGDPLLYYGEEAVRALHRYRAPLGVLRRWLQGGPPNVR